MGSDIFKCTGALDPELHARVYRKRPEDSTVRRELNRVGKECVLISLIGARQTGKTSLLNLLHYEYSKLRIWVPIKIDLSQFSEVEGEQWYSQFIATCCEQLQKCGIDIAVEDVQKYCQPLYIPPFSARGWTELLYVTCQHLAPHMYLLLSLDEINSIPRQQWEPFFSSIRAMHQAASSPNDRPEYRRMAIILAGAFVPKQLIRVVEKSPFNVSTKVYMSNVQREQLHALQTLFSDCGITVEERAIQEIYQWSSGLLYHVQRICSEIALTDSTVVTQTVVESVVEQVLFDDDYLSRILEQIEKDQTLLRQVRGMLNQPIQANRNSLIIATLEVIGAIRFDSTIKKWCIVNLLCKQFLQQYFQREELDGR